MKLCEICGNEIEEQASVCHWCGSQQSGRSTAGRTRRGGRMRTVNLEAGRPLVNQALGKLDMAIATEKRQGVRLLRVVHGYGSSGTGGAIKDAVLSHLRELKRQGFIRDYLWGGDYSDATPQGRSLLSRHPRLRSSLRTDRENEGMSFVEL